MFEWSFRGRSESPKSAIAIEWRPDTKTALSAGILAIGCDRRFLAICDRDRWCTMEWGGGVWARPRPRQPPFAFVLSVQKRIRLTTIFACVWVSSKGSSYQLHFPRAGALPLPLPVLFLGNCNGNPLWQHDNLPH